VSGESDECGVDGDDEVVIFPVGVVDEFDVFDVGWVSLCVGRAEEDGDIVAACGGLVALAERVYLDISICISICIQELRAQAPLAGRVAEC